jgi:3-mercaptopyruvate sulfurtransferase SseA
MSRQDKRKTLFLWIAGIALIIAACAPSTPQPQAGPASPNIEAPQEVQRVTLEESKAAFDSEAAVFLDVRNESSYAASHIPGALSIPLEELEARIAELDPGQWIITYCT